MDALLFFPVSFAAIALIVFGLVAALIAATLLAAAMLPRGHPLADHLRAFAAGLPRQAWRAAHMLDALLFLGLMALFAFLAVRFA